jgi:hypothetical protein
MTLLVAPHAADITMPTTVPVLIHPSMLYVDLANSWFGANRRKSDFFFCLFSCLSSVAAQLSKEGWCQHLV